MAGIGGPAPDPSPWRPRHGTMRRVATIERSPAGFEVMRAASDGRARGWSFGADLSRCRPTGWADDNGMPVYVGPIAIVEGSLCPDPADLRCTIERVAGQVPIHRAQAVLAGEHRPVREQHTGRRRTGWPGKRPSSWRR